jgi:hypothetical protein
MNMYHSDAYRTAFLAYIRKGMPIRLSTKETVATEQYVWRTQRDSKVRGAHRANDGRIFSWSNPPPTGHPGQDFNCRCEAIPYILGETEFAYHDITTDLSSSGDRWGDIDFVQHYYFGGGVSVDLREIGHLYEIVQQYAFNDKEDGAFRRLAGQIADKAISAKSGAFTLTVNNFYDFGSVQFSHGDGSVKGVFSGLAEKQGEIIKINGTTDFEFYDEFKDPLGYDIEVGGNPYPIEGSWSADFTAEVFVEKNRSNYFDPNT